MENNETIRSLLAQQASRYPQLETDDLLKALYQSAFGCEHFAPSEERVLARLREEMETMSPDAAGEGVEPLAGGYSRAHLSACAAQGVSAQTLARLFLLTAKNAPQGDRHAWHQAALVTLAEMADAGELPLEGKVVCERLAAYRAAGCPALHHSEAFRAAYHPAYRLLRSEYAQLLALFGAIDRRLAGGERVILAIDGRSGAGKSSLAALLASVYDGALVVHMDDFFLQPHQRTAQRLQTPGGNVDHERFLEEVLAPMRRGEAFWYRPFDCGRMEIGEGMRLSPGRLCIVEGSYSLHPSLASAYDLRVALRIDAAAQRARILARNGEQMLARFIEMWIPLEERYFSATRLFARIDAVIDVTPLDVGTVQYDVKAGDSDE